MIFNIDWMTSLMMIHNYRNCEWVRRRLLRRDRQKGHQQPMQNRGCRRQFQQTTLGADCVMHDPLPSLQLLLVMVASHRPPQKQQQLIYNDDDANYYWLKYTIPWLLWRESRRVKRVATAATSKNLFILDQSVAADRLIDESRSIISLYIYCYSTAAATGSRIQMTGQSNWVIHSSSIDQVRERERWCDDYSNDYYRYLRSSSWQWIWSAFYWKLNLMILSSTPCWCNLSSTPCWCNLQCTDDDEIDCVSENERVEIEAVAAEVRVANWELAE